MGVDAIGYVQGWRDPFGLGQRVGSTRYRRKGSSSRLGRIVRPELQGLHQTTRGGERIALRRSVNGVFGVWFASAQTPLSSAVTLVTGNSPVRSDRKIEGK